MANAGHGRPINQVGAFYNVYFAQPDAPDNTTVLRSPFFSSQSNVKTFASLLTALGTATVLLTAAQPFVQSDWGNPQRRYQVQDYIDPSEFWMLDSAVPLNQKDWQNPQPRRLQLLTDYIDPTQFWLLAPQSPFAQSDWPNPQSPRRNADLGHIVSGYPVADYVLRLPVNTRVLAVDQRAALLSTALGSSLTIISSVIQPRPFVQGDWQNPQQTRQRNEFGFADASEFWMLNSQVPINQKDWQNPQGQQRRSEYSGFTDSYKVNLFAAPPTPFYLMDWPNPQRAKLTNDFGFSDPSEFWMLNSIIPFAQGDWKNPQPQRQRSEYAGFTDQYKVLLFAAPPSPFYLLDWPNPRRPKASVGDQLGYIDPTEFWSLNGLKPINQNDWQNPQGPRQRSEYAGFSDPYKVLLFAAPPSPFYLTDWKNPQQPRGLIADQLGFTDPTEFWMLNSLQPFNQVEWSNPLRGKSAIFGYDLKLNLQLQTVISPFSQFSWPNPTQSRRPPSDHVDQNKFSLYRIFDPFVQRDWPNPVLAKPALVRYVGYFDVYKVNLKSTPQRQIDWPNPSLGALRTFANFGFSVRQQAIPGIFHVPVFGQALLTTYQPMTTFAHLHHWRTTINLLGNKVVKSDLQGEIDNDETLQGNIDKKTDLEGG